MIKDSKWYLITIDDAPKYLPGKSIFDIIQLILKVIKFKYVILDDINGVAEAAVYLQNKEGIAILLKDFLEIVGSVKQFEWGDFLLFIERPHDWEEVPNYLYPHSHLEISDTTVRAVDNQYIYVYTPYQEIVDLIKENYDIESIKTDILQNLDYPD